ncbi:MAG: hypothetical protein A3B82_01065 [Methylophilales bacterium RIFCSPHIGHO2_02_FULL_57_10]|nr:MAG: hypothetical protein A3B82_01065 [Methylophilales bacterium RIFCSPHIGHO2_02_FULL_57_10]
MMFTAHDWRKLQLPLITFGVTLIIATLLYSTTDARKTKMQQLLQTQQNSLNQARQRYQTSGEEKENIVRYLSAYQALVQQGFVGEEQRVDWIDDLRNINIRYKLFGVSYDIGAQQDYKPAFPLDIGNFKLHRSVMKLTFAMLHENDLLTLFQALPGEVNPPFMLRDCTITRVSGGGRGKFVPNLNNSCEIDWLTITEPPTAGDQS